MDPTHSLIRQLAREDVDDMLRGLPDCPSVEQLAVTLNLGTDALRRMLNRGDIPAHRLPNGRWLIRKPAIRAWLMTQHTEGANDAQNR